MDSEGFEFYYSLIESLLIHMKTIELECDNCKNKFDRRLAEVNNRNFKNHFCSRKCKTDFTKTKKEILCMQCGKMALRVPSQLKKTKNSFCSRSCAGLYNNAHKSKGIRKSKLELWLLDQLQQLYPNLKILDNDKTIIGSELDLYFPTLKLAFELNGIYHYEPIFGIKKLNEVQNNELRKFKACHENDISLCVIDTTSQKYFKPSTSQKFLDIIKKIVDDKLSVNS